MPFGLGPPPGSPPSPPTAARDLPAKASDTSAEAPWPVRVLSLKISDYVDKMVPLWVEGQVVQLSKRASTAYLTLRDPEVDMSLSVTISVHTLTAMGAPLVDGARVVVHAKPTFWAKRGTLQLEARSIRPVGVGDLLARVEILKARLAAEGLFEPRRKRPLPFLPRVVGLITGRDSAAARDVVENAKRRWPTVRFDIREVAVQGATTVTEVCQALSDLDARPEVDVIVIARGGGSVEELLPFSNETLVRAVVAARTPVVSAIGHEVDTPLLDFVADVRASTPTDAGRRVVPDAAIERERVLTLRHRARRSLAHRLESERRLLLATRTRPVLTDPRAWLRPHREHLAALHARGRELLRARVIRESDRVHHLGARVRLLSPQSTLDRGYAVVRHPSGQVVRAADEVRPGQPLQVLVARGDFDVSVSEDPAEVALRDTASDPPAAPVGPPQPSTRRRKQERP
ncbi:MAG: exodeoxyribonuclease VII large subunit [Actinomycetales bacterium]|nr:exodeoxyribonuclease VII large subunit [Actinomycetales bacterium]